MKQKAREHESDLAKAAAWFIGVITCLTTNAAIASTPDLQKPRIIAYVAAWSIPTVIHPEKLTHINFAFAHIDGDGKVMFKNAAFPLALKSLVELKQQNPELKVMVSVGGWESEGFSDAALTDASRNTFAQSAVALLREHLDAVSDAEKRSGPDRYTLTIASADREYFEHAEMNRLHVILDWLNIMSYDFFNSLTSTTGHHAGLYASEFAAPTDRNADASVRQHVAAGIPSDKLVLGVAFYGRGFTGVKPANNGLNQPYARYEGDHSYAELADKLIGREGFTRYWDERAKAPFLWNEAEATLITYDDPQSIRAKADYVRNNGLGGMMFWELSQDRNDELLDVIVTALRRTGARL